MSSPEKRYEALAEQEGRVDISGVYDVEAGAVSSDEVEAFHGEDEITGARAEIQIFHPEDVQSASAENGVHGASNGPEGGGNAATQIGHSEDGGSRPHRESHWFDEGGGTCDLAYSSTHDTKVYGERGRGNFGSMDARAFESMDFTALESADMAETVVSPAEPGAGRALLSEATLAPETGDAVLSFDNREVTLEGSSPILSGVSKRSADDVK
eukprot:3444574-Rhodomonas_salina.1